MNDENQVKEVTSLNQNMVKHFSYFLAMSVFGSAICAWAVIGLHESTSPNAPDKEGYMYTAIGIVSVMITSAFCQWVINRKVSRPISGALMGLLNVILAYFLAGITLSTLLFLGSASGDIGAVLVILGAGFVAIFVGLFFTGLFAVPTGLLIGYFYVKKRGPLPQYKASKTGLKPIENSDSIV